MGEVHGEPAWLRVQHHVDRAGPAGTYDLAERVGGRLPRRDHLVIRQTPSTSQDAHGHLDDRPKGAVGRHRQADDVSLVIGHAALSHGSRVTSRAALSVRNPT